jgi:predicted DNA-binding helix-hairpin-helix protein
MLDLEIDPKLAWALRNRHLFPVDVNMADRELLLRVPGLGKRAVDRIILARRHTTLRLSDIARLTTALKRARPFLVTPEHRPIRLTDRADLRARLIHAERQPDLFAWPTTASP